MCSAINGYMFGNLPDLSMCKGNKIHWHLLGMGNEMDVHSIHFNGQILTRFGHVTDTVSLFPASFVNVVMEADNIGQWLMSDQVNDYAKGTWGKVITTCKKHRREIASLVHVGSSECLNPILHLIVKLHTCTV